MGSNILPSEFSKLTLPRIQAILKAMEKEEKPSTPVKENITHATLVKRIDKERKRLKIGKYADGN